MLVFVLLTVLLAEVANGFSDAPVGTSAAVASKVLTSRQALWITAIGNFVGLLAAILFGAAVAKTIGTGIVRSDLITINSIGVAMMTTVIWAFLAVWLGLPISKTHSLLAALAGIGYAQGGFEALLPMSGNWQDSGWISVGKGVFLSIICGAAFSWFFTRIVVVSRLDTMVSEQWWRHFQFLTVACVSTGHGFNDGLKYVGVFTLVLYKSGMISDFHVLPGVILLCAVVMGLGTLFGGWRIHRRLDAMVNQEHKKPFKPYMGVSAEMTAGVLIWQSGFLGIPMSTNHGMVASMAGAKSATGRVHVSSLVRIIWGWVITYMICFFLAESMTSVLGLLTEH